MRRVLRALLLASTCLSLSPAALAIDNRLGVDPNVDYTSLTRYGPWDDRNYHVTADDLALLHPEERYENGVPVFFKVLVRKEREVYKNYYPRSFRQEFKMRFGGLLVDGEMELDGLGLSNYPTPETSVLGPSRGQVIGENRLSNLVGGNEVTVSFNPANGQQAIAGANSNGGQEMYYSTNAGETWTVQGRLPQTCCDPATDWSSDGLVAYAAALSSSPIRTLVYRSTDGGQTWTNRQQLSNVSSDKEFIHSDKSPTSPHLDNVYVTWHQSNVMQFARSTNRAQSFQTPISFSALPRGIGSDITTDPEGRIYYVYPTLEGLNSRILMLRSDNGGTSFLNQSNPNAVPVVRDLHGEFEYGVPSMETRLVFSYTAIASDHSNGPNRGRIYVIWNDKTDGTLGSPTSPAGRGGTTSANHSWVRVSWSDDQGLTWSTPTYPHSLADTATVDRYHPWIDVDSEGVVHVGFYDTRHSLNRTGVDFYYNYSTDGAATWETPVRVSAQTSNNLTDGQEWGDYNGISVSRLSNRILTSWTDNRPGGGKHSYSGRLETIEIGPPYQMGAPTTPFEICAGQMAGPIAINVSAPANFLTPITLSLQNPPTGFSNPQFNPNPVNPSVAGTASSFSIQSSGSTAPNLYQLQVRGVAAGGERTVNVPVNVRSNAIPGIANLSAPGNGQTAVNPQPTLTWQTVNGATGYRVQIARDAGFTQVVYTGDTDNTSLMLPIGLAFDSEFYWRVQALTPCQQGAQSAPFRFRTAAQVCNTTVTSIPDGSRIGVTLPISVATESTIDEIEVYARIDHTAIGDLNIAIRNSSSGRSAQLLLLPLDNGDPCQGDNLDATFADDGLQVGNDICSNSALPAIGGRVRAVDLLSGLGGTQLSTSWNLTVIDPIGLNSGSVREWCLRPSVRDDLIFANGVAPLP